MSDLHAMTDRELGASLARLGAELAWPRTPDVAPAVAAELRAQQASPTLVVPRLSLPSRRRTLLLIVAVFLMLAAAALAVRLVVELGAATVEVNPGTPTALPTDVISPADLGREVTLARAEATVGFDAALPPELAQPDRVWVDETEIDFETHAIASRIVSAWEPSAALPAIPGTETGALLMQFEGDWEVAAKKVHSETNRFGEATVDGSPAFWTTGPHELRLVTGDRTRRVLVTGTVVIWQEGDFTFRLESALPKEQAIALAETVPSPTEII